MSGGGPGAFPPTTATDVATAAQLACLLEATAPKPGNVYPGSEFGDTRYEDFLASAAAIGPAMAEAGARTLGHTIRAAVESTRRWTRANTNLGIVLLFAPLARAALTRRGDTLRERLRKTLATATVGDAADAYAAIRLAAPGGLGTSDTQDVANPPTVTLLAAMALAAGRDTIASEYTTAFAVTFDIGVPALTLARRVGLRWSDAIVETYLALLAAVPDSLIARKLGRDAAADVSSRARAVLDAGGVRSAAGRQAIAAFDRELRDPRNSRNPGTTADIAAATILAALLAGEWHSNVGGTHGQAR